MASPRTILKKFIPRSLFQKIEPTGHMIEAIIANVRYGFPSRDMHVIGVTGTNGKTTTSFMIHNMLHKAGYKVGLLTTVAYGVGDDIMPQVAHMTTVSAPELQKRLAEFKSQGVEWVVLETTSHALAQHRVWGVPYEIAVLTNITHEHLDYHGTFERYLVAKRYLFELAAKHGMRFGVVNADDEHAGDFIAAIPNSIAYGIKTGELTANNIELSPEGSHYEARIGSETYAIHCRIPGEFNVYNSLAAVAVGRKVGLSREQIEQGIESLEGVEGRMTVIDEGQPFNVVIDYAHTPDSFEKLFKTLRPLVKGKMIAVFGSAGRRDEEKRAVQGQLAGKYADEIVLTEEDDRDIDGQEILEHIAAGAEKEGKVKDHNLFLIHDRSEAIRFALSRAERGDTVLLLGKGHEKDILRNGPKAAELRHLQQDDTNPERVVAIPWDEAGEARRALHELYLSSDKTLTK
ncbi:MAG TPA: UDP-N-acetylmuramoyl-L-alanyl-D-glutamate--2,6-diaminopimelate ligase [Candidatus Saccharimonadales bacterium]|nr:UDP-N-acetylmuramoyl-L-alanyl-D-glutamate--2,6-diaminopimelate ligase [Candidatus Saccharimonadales bacterium]